MEIKVENDTNIRIDKYLTDYMDESRSLIDKMIKNSFILVNGENINTHYIPRVGDIITIEEMNEDIDIVGEDIKLNIIYEDDYLMVINKESGMVVHPAPGNTHGTLVNALKYYTDSLSDINGEFRPGIVHRLDKDTSGIMLVAKTNKTHELLSDMLAKHEIKRHYIALVKGIISTDTATIDAPIGRDEKNRKKMAVTSKNSKNAITHLEVIKRYKDFTLVNLLLETGRTHQIRVHMNYINHPVYNDPLYTNDSTTDFGQFLHSSSIDFIHPITNEKLHFECELPSYFKDFLDTLEESE